MEIISNDPSQMEINISNQNAQGQIVLNDHKLLELIVLYPFLYNPRASPYQDPDYDNWAWQNITSAFNEYYKSYELEKLFTASQLNARWQELKPIIATLLRAQDAIPTPLKRLIVDINLGSNTSGEISSRALSKVENLILENIPMVENLPLRERKRLEAEVMELLLNTELEAHGTVILGPVEQDTIEKEYNEFLQTISIKSLAVLDKSESTQLSSDFLTDFINIDSDSDSPSIQLDEESLMDDLRHGEEQLMDYRLDTDIENKITLEVNNGPGQLDFEEVDTNPPEQLLADVKSDLLTIEHQQITETICNSWKEQYELPQTHVNANTDTKELTPTQQLTSRTMIGEVEIFIETHEEADIDVKPLMVDLIATQKEEPSKKSMKKECSLSTNTKLLNDVASNPLVPLKNARNLIKNFRVLVKRLNLDDYIPLATYRKRRKNRR